MPRVVDLGPARTSEGRTSSGAVQVRTSSCLYRVVAEERFSWYRYRAIDDRAAISFSVVVSFHMNLMCVGLSVAMQSSSALESRAIGQPGGLNSVFGPQFRQKPTNLSLHRSFGDVEQLTDIGVRQAASHQA